MAVPDFPSLMRPILDLLSDESSREVSEIRDGVAVGVGLEAGDREQRLRSGGRVFNNRVAWALVHIGAAGLVTRPARGTYRITERGSQVLADNPERVDLRTLAAFREYQDWSRRREREEVQTIEGSDGGAPPEEAMDQAERAASAALGVELLERVHAASPGFFENLVLTLLQRMGYGAPFADAVRHVGGAGDEGIDGVISEDRLGLDVIYLQAKKWDPARAVGRPELQAFVGALHGQGAAKGIFITTARFTREAQEYVRSLASPRVTLIDGATLADLMIESEVGVTVRRRYLLKRMDEGFFAEEEGIV
ncbi:MAG: restriction endonuclease [Actinomycetota bacterium]